jgi:hypothetical protein
VPSVRIQKPASLPGATEFSADRDILGPSWYVKTLKQTRWLYDELEAATKLDKNWGRRKDPGSWALAYLAFVVSNCADVEPWWKNGGDAIWRECGFAARPPYPTVYERFVELESVSDEFFAIASKLIQHCKRHEPLIGAHVHIDGTEAETHAALVHDCQPGEGCLWHSGQGQGKKPTRTAERPKRISTEQVREQRQKDADQPPSDQPNIGEAEEVKVLEDGRMRVRVGQHWYRTLDSTAGVRAYMGPRGAKRFWHGFYNLKSIDHYTGAPVAVGVYSASLNEHHSYPDLLKRTIGAIGDSPECVVADKGFSIEAVFAHNTNLGIASVIPWRKRNGHERRHDFTTHDRHGIPRCKHCGAPSRFVRFRVSDKGPRLWFKCELGATPACAKEQTISCQADWRLLIPLWRTDAIYHELEQTHSNYERVHRHWRERYLVAGDSLANRPKRRGRAWQELRAQAALVCEWLCIAFREGWLGSARRNKKAKTNLHSLGEKGAKGLKRFRAKVGLRKPYGPNAAALGLGNLEPPSRRGKAPPPALPPDEDALPF